MTQHRRRHGDIFEHVRMPEHTRSELQSGPHPSWTIEERRSELRELIVHEDKLTTDRIQALYTLQGFLFAAFGLLTHEGFPLAPRTSLMITIIAVIGITSARVYWQELDFNTAAITQMLREWDDLKSLFPDITYPRIIGFVATGEQQPGGPKWLPRRTVPALFIIVWLVAAAVTWL